MPADANVASSEEYKQTRSVYTPIFAGEPESEETIVLDGYARYHAVCLSYGEMRPRPDGLMARYAAKKVAIMDRDGRPIHEYRIVEDRLLLQIIRHGNGRDYLLFNVDLYGYSVMDLTTRDVVHYIPEASLRGGEPFLWLEALYCPVNNLLAVGGCYWACPWSMEFHDFANPMRLPLPCYCDSFALEERDGVAIDGGLKGLRFTDAGECVIPCRDAQGCDVEKIFDVTQGYNGPAVE